MKNLKIILIAILAVAALSILIVSYSFISNQDQEQLILYQDNNNNNLATIKYEVADTEQAIATGLMNRNSLPEDEGMLFIFDHSQAVSFWMKNTYIPLDIIFIDENMSIVNIARDTEPLSLIPIPSIQPIKYVVEVNAGFTHTNNINVKDKINY